MERPHLRPRFKQEFPCPPETVIGRLRKKLEESDQVGLWSALHPHLVLCIAEKDRHYWSPILDLHVDETPDAGTLIWGHYGPHPNVWTMFTAIYASIGFLGFLGLMYGLSQLMVKEPPYGLLAVPLSIALMGGVYLIAFIGQRMAHAQMHELKQFFDETLCDM